MSLIDDADSLTWGRLVKSWATGLDYINTPASQQPPHPPAAGPPPTATWTLPNLTPVNFDVQVGASITTKTIPGALWLTTTQFAALLQGAGINTVNFPTGATEVIIVQGSATTMIIRLPPAAVLQTSEQRLLAGGPYPTPSFYEPLFSPPGGPIVHANTPMLPDVAGIMDLHANRIGDYTMGLCA